MGSLVQLDWTKSGAGLQAAFEKFDRENPAVYETLVGLARRWKDRGDRKCGVGLLFEVMRWEVYMTTRGDDFKLNNNWRSRYVRKLIADHPEFENFFELRELKAV